MKALSVHGAATLRHRPCKGDEVMNSKRLVAAALALTGAFGASLVHAHGRDDVQWSVTIGTPAAAPVYRAPVYNAPVQVYTPAMRGYNAPVPVIAPHRRDTQPTRWDRDGDGIPNRYDRVYNPRWDRDGDGVPNRYDRHDDRADGRRGGR
jgi:hypothetical protein